MTFHKNALPRVAVDAMDMIVEFDIGGDGTIGLDDFCRLMTEYLKVL